MQHLQPTKADGERALTRAEAELGRRLDRAAMAQYREMQAKRRRAMDSHAWAEFLQSVAAAGWQAYVDAHSGSRGWPPPSAEEQASHARDEAARIRARAEADIDSRMTLLARTLDAGRRAFLYESVYVPVDSIVNEERAASSFTLEPLAARGYEGWEVVATVPRTMGVALENRSFGSTMGTTWGAGMGGNVVGVHVVLRLAVDPDDRGATEPLVRAHFERVRRQG